MQGLHLTADLTGCRCDAAWLTDAGQLLAYCTRAVQAVGLHAVNQVSHTFPATTHGLGGVTATILLAESHLCVHTWPELRGVTVDVYVCNFGDDHSHQAERLMEWLIQRFEPTELVRHRIQRGNLRGATEAATAYA
jgi:S-adenosylmethionine decarboxylase